MKKSISTLFSIAIILAACLSPSGGASAPINTARPQVTVASEATATFAPTPTDAPIPTPTPSSTPEPPPTLSPEQQALAVFGKYQKILGEYGAGLHPTVNDQGQVELVIDNVIVYHGDATSGAFRSDKIVEIVEKAGICQPTNPPLIPLPRGDFAADRASAEQKPAYSSYVSAIFTSALSKPDFKAVMEDPNPEKMNYFTAGYAFAKDDSFCWMILIARRLPTLEPFKYAVVRTPNGIAGFPLFEP